MVNILQTIADNIYSYIINKPIFVVAVLIACAFGIVYLFYGKKPYCYIRILEKRGDVFIDHGKVYKGVVHKVRDSETSNYLKWMHIEKLKKNWCIPKGEDLTPTLKGHRLVTLAWFGGNHFQLVRLTKYGFKKLKDGHYKKYPLNKVTLRIIPDNLKHLDYQISTNIDRLMYDSNWFDKYLKPHLTLIIVGFLCVAMVWIVTNQMGTKMSETAAEVKNFGERFVSWAKQPSQTTVDSKTVKSPNTPGGG